jgi:hypothetical protein
MCILWQGCTNSLFQVAWVTKLYMVAPNICEGSVGNVLLVTLLVPRILIWLLDILKKGVPPCNMAFHITSNIVLYILLQAVVIAWGMHELVSLEV